MGASHFCLISKLRCTGTYSLLPTPYSLLPTPFPNTLLTNQFFITDE
ncbi:MULTISPECIES: hypothetical protein [Moorena]|nr:MULTISPECIES: hypothetical protein [Moorena]NEP36320.1 hypothetical protein [Moorena sp. SIO3B2]NEP65130.1 hypothetical protein [Moorena sp. SIO3A5]NER90602.1 hypothetical protein [Moorena sp. SIO3A2]NES41056.1 hypothetical protein [Moorena sp. SIO2C4]NET67192.1 hypothetical protein [Moorena sp. SIO1G6]